MTHMIEYHPNTAYPLNSDLLASDTINKRDYEGRNALYWAIESHSESMTRILLQHSIDLCVEKKHHALFHAVKSTYTTLVGYILAQDVNINMRNDQGQTPLMVAIQRNNSAMVRYLLRYGADTTLSCYQNRTVYDYAKMTRNSEIINLVESSRR